MRKQKNNEDWPILCERSANILQSMDHGLSLDLILQCTCYGGGHRHQSWYCTTAHRCSL